MRFIYMGLVVLFVSTMSYINTCAAKELNVTVYKHDDHVFIETINTTKQRIRDIRLRVLGAEDNDLLLDKFNLYSGQKRVDSFIAKEENISVVASYTFMNISNASFTQHVSDKDRSLDKVLELLIPALIGLVGAAVGAGLNHLLTNTREVQKEKLSLRKATYERNEKAYRKFASSWNLSLIPSVLFNSFHELQSEVIVPSTIDNLYRATYKSLSDPAHDVSIKTKNAEALYKEILDFATNDSLLDK